MSWLAARKINCGSTWPTRVRRRNLAQPLQDGGAQSSVTDPIFARVDPNAYPMGGMGHFPEAFYLRYFEPQNLAPFPHRFSIMD